MLFFYSAVFMYSCKDFFNFKFLFNKLSYRVNHFFFDNSCYLYSSSFFSFVHSFMLKKFSRRFFFILLKKDYLQNVWQSSRIQYLLTQSDTTAIPASASNPSVTIPLPHPPQKLSTRGMLNKSVSHSVFHEDCDALIAPKSLTNLACSFFHTNSSFGFVSLFYLQCMMKLNYIQNLIAYHFLALFLLRLITRRFLGIISRVLIYMVYIFANHPYVQFHFVLMLV